MMYNQISVNNKNNLIINNDEVGLKAIQESLNEPLEERYTEAKREFINQMKQQLFLECENPSDTEVLERVQILDEEHQISVMNQELEEEMEELENSRKTSGSWLYSEFYDKYVYSTPIYEKYTLIGYEV